VLHLPVVRVLPLLCFLLLAAVVPPASPARVGSPLLRGPPLMPVVWLEVGLAFLPPSLHRTPTWGMELLRVSLPIA